MAKAKTVFFCTNCGNESPKWMGRCPGCGAFNTMQEHIEKPVPAGKAKPAPVGQSRTPQRLREVTGEGEIRFSTGMGELNRVLGGGAVAGSLVPGWVYNIGTTVLNGGVSMVVFFIVNKIVFNDAKAAQKEAQ